MQCLIHVDLKWTLVQGGVRNFIGTFSPLYMHETFAKYLAQDLAKDAWCQRETLSLT